MSKRSSLRWLFVRLPVDPDAPTRPGAQPLPLGVSAALVAIGGIAGSLARAWIGVAVHHQAASWPWSTLIVNVVGSGALAILLVVLIERFPQARVPRPLIGTGLLGGFTTFSTFAVDFVQLSHGGRPTLAVLYVLVTLATTGAAAVTGVFAARTFDRLLDRERWRRRVDQARFSDASRSEA